MNLPLNHNNMNRNWSRRKNFKGLLSNKFFNGNFSILRDLNSDETARWLQENNMTNIPNFGPFDDAKDTKKLKEKLKNYSKYFNFN